jgi:outer membrane lipoprotein-sorting protein
MMRSALIFIHLLTFSLCACASPQPVSPATTQTALLEAWAADQHTVWEIDWPDAPVGGPLTVETWRVGSWYRYEILESTAPALVGEILVFDGQTAWQYNRFDDSLLSSHKQGKEASELALSPVSDAFAVINRLLTTPAQTAGQEAVTFNHHSTQKITLTFDHGDQLALWRDETTNLPVRITFAAGGQEATLKARSFERLTNPPAGLFKP